VVGIFVNVRGEKVSCNVPTADLERQLLTEYLDLPGLNLTLSQVSRLLSADAQRCREMLAKLEASGCVTCTADGHYVRSVCRDGLKGWRVLARRRIDAVTRGRTTMPSRVTTFVAREKRRPTQVLEPTDQRRRA
jgi:hypothetical protein